MIVKYFPVISKLKFEGLDLSNYVERGMFNAIRDLPEGWQKLKEVMVDSGGLQVFEGKVSGVDENKVFEIQSKVQQAFILDVPNYNATNMEDWRVSIRKTVENVKKAIDYGLQDKLIYIMHGGNEEELKEWWEALQPFFNGRLALGFKPEDSSRISALDRDFWGLKYLVEDLGVDKIKQVHFLGDSPDSMEYMLVASYIGSEKICDLITLDSSKPVKLALNLKISHNSTAINLREIDNYNPYFCGCLGCQFTQKNWELWKKHDFNNLDYGGLILHNIIFLDNIAKISGNLLKSRLDYRVLGEYLNYKVRKITSDELRKTWSDYYISMLSNQKVRVRRHEKNMVIEI